eukprot:TRINITY_DN39044_c0_g1_i1.p1 TRINITY_DN39044_c0_g1~~TRINITY_DN39044_c0_g1_i1.p1  ORF type:complete len:171 (+),score=23.14 TRINITY_DN39044_c0_g1_i1:38-550(+)
MKICVTNSAGENYDMDVDPSCSIRELSGMVQKNLGIREPVRLLQDGMVLDKHSTLEKVGALDGSIFHIVVTPNVSVTLKSMNGHAKTIEVASGTSVDELATFVLEMLEEKAATRRMAMVFRGKDIFRSCGDKSLDEVGITDGSTIHLTFRSRPAALQSWEKPSDSDACKT